MLALPRLQRLVLPDIDTRPTFPAEVAAACPDVLVETKAVAYRHVLDQNLTLRSNPILVMVALGARLPVCSFRSIFRPSAAFAEAAAACTSLRSLTVTDLGRDAVEFVDALFVMPRLELHELRLSFTDESIDVATCMRKVAAASGALEILYLEEVPLVSALCQSLAVCNSGLRKVVILLNEGETNLVEIC